MSHTSPDPADRPGRAAGTDRSPPAEPRRVGVLSPHNSKETKAILNAVRALGHEPVWLRDENVAARVVDGEVTLTPEVDVLVNRLLVTKSDDRLEDLELVGLYDDAVPVLNPPSAVAATVHKPRAAARLAAAGLPVPDTHFGRTPRTVEDWPDHLSERAVHKQTVGTNGQGMGVVEPGDPVGPRRDGERAFLQAFLGPGEDRAADVRAYVVGGEVVGAMRRTAPAGEWRANVALGADVADVTDELGAEPRRLARAAVDALELDLAGVDLLPVDGDWYVLEVNATAGFKGLYEATGESVAPHVARLAVERAGGGVDGGAVAELTGGLDDSVPDCKPPLAADGDGGVVGLTERVRVAGRAEARSVVAKADSGAARTTVDADLAGAVGAGPLAGTTDVRVSPGGDAETRPLVTVSLRVDGDWHEVTADVADRSAADHPLLLGRDVLAGYSIDVGRTVEE